MRIVSIFKSIDGEVNAWGTGRLTTFVRLAECNLRCKYCVGTRPRGVKKPFVTLKNGERKPLIDIVVGDELATFDDDGNPVVTTVVHTETRHVDTWHRIEVNSRGYLVTNDHPFYTAEGLVEAQNLVVGNNVIYTMDGKALENEGMEVDKVKAVNRLKIDPTKKVKPLPVHTISCQPYNSYVLDSMWMHNCDTTFSFGKGTEMSVEEVYEQIKATGTKKITLTGGEPLLQLLDVLELVNKLTSEGFNVSIETNGTISPPIALRTNKNVSLVLDYKLPSSGMESKMDLFTFQGLGERDFIKFVVSDDIDLHRALDIRRQLDSRTGASFAYSPVHNGMPPDVLAEVLMQQGKGDELLNVQLHKILWPDCGEGEER